MIRLLRLEFIMSVNVQVSKSMPGVTSLRPIRVSNARIELVWGLKWIRKTASSTASQMNSL